MIDRIDAISVLHSNPILCGNAAIRRARSTEEVTA
jgi:hypothetical protein